MIKKINDFLAGWPEIAAMHTFIEEVSRYE